MVLATLFAELAGKGFRYFNNPTYLKWQHLVVFKDKNFQECPSRCGQPIMGPAIGLEHFVGKMWTSKHGGA